MVIDQIKQIVVASETLKFPEDAGGIRQMWAEVLAQRAKYAVDPKNQWRKEAKYKAERLQITDDMSDEEVMSYIAKQKEEALEDLDELVLTIDNANDLHKLDGLIPLLGCLLSSHLGVRWRSAQVVSTITQNNPHCQELVLKHGGLDFLLQNLQEGVQAARIDQQDSKDESDQCEQDRVKVTWKTLGALSCLLNQFPQSEQAFDAAKGPSVVIEAFLSRATDARGKKKALLLLNSYIDAQPQTKPNLIALGLVPACVQLMSHDDIDLRELALNVIIKLSPAALQEPTLKPAVVKRLRELKALKNQEDIDQTRDEVELLGKLLTFAIPRQP